GRRAERVGFHWHAFVRNRPARDDLSGYAGCSVERRPSVPCSGGSERIGDSVTAFVFGTTCSNGMPPSGGIPFFVKRSPAATIVQPKMSLAERNGRAAISCFRGPFRHRAHMHEKRLRPFRPLIAPANIEAVI